MGKGGRRLAALLALIPVVLACSWLVADRFQSPAQREASARPPEPSALLEPVERGDLVESVEAPGILRYQHTAVLAPTELPAHAVITSNAARVGRELRNADLLLALNGRPVFVIESPFAFYRPLAPGLRGPDVRQLQKALESAGYVIPTREHGTFGAATERAVSRLYGRHGFGFEEISEGGERRSEVRASVALTEVAAAPSLPAHLSRVARRGEHPTSETGLATVGAGALVVDAQVPNSAAARFRVGMTATAEVPGRGDPLPMTLAEIRATPVADEQSLTSVILKPTVSTSPAKEGQAVQVRVVVRVLARSALLVPTRSIGQQVSGKNVLLRARAGSIATVEVTVLGSLGGLSAVVAADQSALSEADKVKVG